MTKIFQYFKYASLSFQTPPSTTNAFPTKTERTLPYLTKPSSSLLSISSPNVWDSAMEMHESLQSLMKFDATPLMLHYLNQSSFKHQYLSPPPSDNHIHFIPYGLLQPTEANTVKNQTTHQNRFLAQTGIVPIFNITPETMQSGLKDSVLERISVIGFEPTYLTTK